jgi:radical SAM additional 4Fe4S-binding domain
MKSQSNTYILNPDYVLKNDVNRIILFAKRKPENGGKRGWLSYLHPAQAMVFSFFTYDRTLGENIELISKFLVTDFNSINTLIQPFIENTEGIRTEWNGQDITIPANLLIDSRNVPCTTDKYANIPIENLRCNSDVDVSVKRINTMPLMFTFMLTNKCVTKCKYCYADTDTQVKTKLSTERILELIRSSHDLGIQNINLIGGEIFLHKDWDVILSELISYGYEPDIISTKYPMTEKIIRRLEDLNFMNPIQISLDAYNKHILCDTLEVQENYLQKIKDSIILLDKSKLRYQISSVLTQYNASTVVVSELFNFINTLNRIESWSLRPAINSLYKGEFEKIKLKKGQIVDLYQFIEKNIIPLSRVKIDLDKSLLGKEYYSSDKGSKSFVGAKCSALNSHMFVLPDGKVTICEQLYWKSPFIIGDLSTQSITDVWNSPRVRDLINFDKKKIQKESKCRSCQIFENCFNKDKNRCWADIIKAYGDANWDFPDPRCNKAPLMRANIGF